MKRDKDKGSLFEGSLFSIVASIFLNLPRRQRRRARKKDRPARGRDAVAPPRENRSTGKSLRLANDKVTDIKTFEQLSIPVDEDLADRHYGRLIVASIFISIVVGGFAFWQARPLYHYYQKQSALSQIDEIERAIGEKDYLTASHIAADAYQKAPQEPEVLRAASRVALAVHSPEAPFFLEKLIRLGAATFEDRRGLAEASLRLGEHERASEISEQLLAERPDDLDLLRIVVDVRRAQEDPVSALKLLMKIVELDPGDSGSRMLCAKLLIAHGSKNDRNLGWRFLWRLAETDPTEIGVEALNVLLLGQGYKNEHKAALVKLLEAHPLAEESHRIAALELKIFLYPESKTELLRQAVEFRRDWEARKLTPLYRSLNTLGEFDFIVETLSLERSRKNQELLVIYLDAMGRQGRWDEVRTILADPTLPLSEVTLQTFSALCSKRLNEDETVIEEYLQKSLRAATTRGMFAETYGAGQFAEAAGLFELAEIAYRISQRSDESADKGYAGLQRIASKQGDDLKLRDVTAKYHYRFPRRAQIYENLLYLNALVGIEIETSLEKALELIEEESFRAAPRIIAGLAYYRMNDFQRAAETTGPCKVDELSDGQKTVYAAIAAATNRTQLALEIARDVETEKLLATERKLLPSPPL